MRNAADQKDGASSSAPPSASSVIWSWREAGSRDDRVSRPRPLRVLLEAGVAACVASLLIVVFDAPVMGAVVLSIAALVLVSGLAAPGLYGRLRRGADILSRVVGVTLSWVLLVPFYYVCFGISHLVLILARRDPMRRTYDASLDSYWLPHGDMPPKGRYRKQY